MNFCGVLLILLYISVCFCVITLRCMYINLFGCFVVLFSYYFFADACQADEENIVYLPHRQYKGSAIIDLPFLSMLFILVCISEIGAHV